MNNFVKTDFVGKTIVPMSGHVPRSADPEDTADPQTPTFLSPTQDHENSIHLEAQDYEFQDAEVFTVSSQESEDEFSCQNPRTPASSVRAGDADMASATHTIEDVDEADADCQSQKNYKRKKRVAFDPQGDFSRDAAQHKKHSNVLFSETHCAQGVAAPELKSISLRIYADDEIRRLAHVQVTHPALYENGKPRFHGLLDPRMGSGIDRTAPCHSCGRALCNGHDGYIELGTLIYRLEHIFVIRGLLQVVCPECARPRFSPNGEGCEKRRVGGLVDARAIAESTLPGRKRLEALSKACKTKMQCQHCLAPLPKYVSGKGERKIHLEAVYSEKAFALANVSPEHRAALLKPFKPSDARSILSHIPHSALRFIGFHPEHSHPKWLVTGVQFVPPICLRPSLSLADGACAKSEDDMTLNLQDVVKATVELKHAQEALRAAKIAFGDAAPNAAPNNTAAVSEHAADTDVLGALGVASSSNSSGGGGVKSKAKARAAAQKRETPQQTLKRLEQDVQDYEDKVQVMVTGCYNQSIVKSMPRLRGVSENLAMRGGASKRQRLDYRALLQGKTGYFRGNMTGKRTDFNARCVLGPDSNENAHWVGVPSVVMDTLTFPDKVNFLNLKRLQAKVLRGASHPEGGGALFVIETLANGEKRTRALAGRSREELSAIAAALKVGDVVERQMEEGDVALMGRQPTLREHSLLAFFVYRVYTDQFLLPLATMPPLNADCDGDEVNLQLPQTEEARAEAILLMLVPHHIVSAQTGGAIIMLVQDACVGAYTFTSPNVLLPREEVLALLMHVQFAAKGPTWNSADILWKRTYDELWPCLSQHLPRPAILKSARGPLWSGAQIFSMLFPRSLSLGDEARRWKAPQSGIKLLSKPLYGTAAADAVVLKQGELLCGRLSKATVGGVVGGIVHRIHSLGGPWAALKFISDAQRLMAAWMTRASPSIGFTDCVVNEATKESVAALLKDSIADADAVTVLDAQEDEKEARIHEILGNAQNRSAELVLSSVDEHNALKTISDSGAKGSAANIAQMTTWIGQSTNAGKRRCLRRTFHGERMLPCDSFGDKSVKTRGFICTNFMGGLEPREQFFCMQDARFAIVGTSTDTGKTGYVQRRIVKALESQTERLRGEIRAASNVVVQWRFGGHGYGPESTRAVMSPRFGLVRLPLDVAADLKALPALKTPRSAQDTDDLAMYTAALRASMQEHILKIHAVARAAVQNLSQVKQSVAADAGIADTTGVDDLDLLSEPLFPSTVAHPLHADRRVPLGLDPSYLQRAVLAEALTPEAVLASGVLDEAHLTRLCVEWIVAYEKALMDTSESAGIKSGTFIGEPTTQSVLNFHHKPGQRSANVTVTGLPRMQQLMGSKDTSATANMELVVNCQGLQTRKEKKARADELCRIIKALYVSDVCVRSEICAWSGAEASTSLFQDKDANAFSESLDERLAALTWSTVHRTRSAFADAVSFAALPSASSASSASFGDAKNAPEADTRGTAATVTLRTAASLAALVELNLGKGKCAPSRARIWQSDVEATMGIEAKTHIDATMGIEATQQQNQHRPVRELVLHLDGLKAAAAGLNPESFARLLQKALGCAALVTPSAPAWSKNLEVTVVVLDAAWWTGLSASEAARMYSTPGLATACELLVLNIFQDRLGNVLLRGFKAVKDATSRSVLKNESTLVSKAPKDSEDATRKSAEDAEVWIVDTLGSCLNEAAAHPWVDASASRTNNVTETETLLGIDAATRLLAQEYQIVVSSGTALDPAHTALLADTQGLSGSIVPVAADSMETLGNGILQRATFEKAVSVMADGAAYAKSDQLVDATGRMIIGQHIAAGTGLVELVTLAQATPAAVVAAVGQTVLATEAARNALQRLKADANAFSTIPNVCKNKNTSVSARDVALQVLARATGNKETQFPKRPHGIVERDKLAVCNAFLRGYGAYSTLAMLSSSAAQEQRMRDAATESNKLAPKWKRRPALDANRKALSELGAPPQSVLSPPACSSMPQSALLDETASSFSSSSSRCIKPAAAAIEAAEALTDKCASSKRGRTFLLADATQNTKRRHKTKLQPDSNELFNAANKAPQQMPQKDTPHNTIKPLPKKRRQQPPPLPPSITSVYLQIRKQKQIESQLDKQTNYSSNNSSAMSIEPEDPRNATPPGPCAGMSALLPLPPHSSAC